MVIFILNQILRRCRLIFSIFFPVISIFSVFLTVLIDCIFIPLKVQFSNGQYDSQIGVETVFSTFNCPRLFSGVDRRRLGIRPSNNQAEGQSMWIRLIRYRSFDSFIFFFFVISYKNYFVSGKYIDLNHLPRP